MQWSCIWGILPQNANELRCYWETWFLLFLIVRVIRTKSDGAYNSPHCGGLLSSCRENDATRLKCADALCKAQGYAVGTFVEASNNFCNSHFEYTNYFTAPYHAYALDGHDVYYGNYSNVAIITADCTPSGEHFMTLPMFWCKNVFEQTCYQIINTFTILKIERLWETEITDKTCQNMTLKYVSSQLECQSLCFESISCAGISYNNHGSDHCRLCKDYQLTQAPSGFGFFRRPGKYH